MCRADSLIRENICIKLTGIAQELGVSPVTVHGIVHDQMDFRKACARWPPKIVTKDGRFHYDVLAFMHLTRDAYQREQFLQCVVSGDATYVNRATRESKKAFMTWKHPSSPLVTPSVQKIVPAALCDHRSVHFVDFLDHDDTELLIVIVVHLRGYGRHFVPKGLDWCAMPFCAMTARVVLPTGLVTG